LGGQPEHGLAAARSRPPLPAGPVCPAVGVTATLPAMPRAVLNNGIELEYDTFGSDTDPTLLLIQGLTGQLTAWEEGFCEQLADGGHLVIRFDNRDCGLSTTFEGAEVDVGAVMAA